MTRQVRMRRFFLLALFGYVVLDLACPLVPGAFSFDPAQSVDAVSGYRERPAALARVAAVPPAMTAESVPAETSSHVVAAPAAPPAAVWTPHAGPDDVRASDALPSVDDD